MANKINYDGQIEFLNQKVNASTCIEAFSDNLKKKIYKQKKHKLKHSDSRRQKRATIQEESDS